MNKVLTFLNLLDSEGNLSITNTAVFVCVIKMALSAQFTGMDVGALIATLLNYAHKRSTYVGASE